MIRSPLEVCRERKWETASVSFAVFVVLAIPMCLALSAMSAHVAAAQWLESYTPIVYLTPGTTEADAHSLATEIKGWTLADDALIRSPADARAELVARLGADKVQELGVTDGMLPTSIVVTPSVPIAGHIDLVAKVSGLEARASVDSVEVPSSDAMRVIHFAAVGGLVAVLLSILGVVAAAVLLMAFFGRLRSIDDETDRVLAMFGAHHSELRRPSLVRGLFVGSWCGAAVSVSGCTGLLLWQFYAPHVAGIEVSLPFTVWSTAAAPLLIVPVLAVAASWVATREPVQIWRRANA